MNVMLILWIDILTPVDFIIKIVFIFNIFPVSVQHIFYKNILSDVHLTFVLRPARCDWLISIQSGVTMMCKLQIWIKPLPDLGYFAETRVFAAVLLVVAGKLDQVYILGVQWRTACKTVNTDENMLVSLLVGEGTPAVTLNIQVMLLFDHTTASSILYRSPLLSNFGKVRFQL